MVAPAYVEDTYVDSELSANLDSTFAFEGPEKLLEIWFYKSEHDVPRCSEGLRAIPLERWVKILDMVNCKVLSMKSSRSMDAYLLSESSLFVFPHKMILKTCGTTTTLACIDKLLDTVQKYALGSTSDKREVARVFYSRRSFMFPDKQEYVHRNWKNEVAVLNKYFPNGKCYVVGNYNSDDHWYLYMGGKGCQNSSAFSKCDQTFEILMTELNPVKAQEYVTSRNPGVESLIKKEGFEDHDLGHDIGLETLVRTGLDSIFEAPLSKNGSHQLPTPGKDEHHREDFEHKGARKLFIHDAFSFSPCGFSSNSISLLSDCYYTMHITPESGWSYASFETNYSFSDESTVQITDVLAKVLNIFEPGKFSVAFITQSHDFYEDHNIRALLKHVPELNHVGYEKRENALYDLNDNYKLLYLNLAKRKFETF